MAYSNMRTDFLKFELSPGGSFRSSPEINYICIPTSEGVKRSTISALETLKLPQGQSFLVQFWAAIETGKTCVLTTTSQPFGLCGINQELDSYRIACLDHKLYVHPKKRVAFGLPGRVFLNLVPEETQNLHNYPQDQRPPCQDDIFSKIWGSFGMPVIEANKCVGVLEFVTDPPQDSYANFMHAVYYALERAGLRSSIQIHNPREVTASPSPWKSIRRSYSFSKTAYCCLVPYFGLSKAEAADRLKIRPSTFRNVRIRVGIPEWPFIPNYKTISSETTTANNHGMPDCDIGTCENLCAQTGTCFPDTQTNEIAYNPNCFGTDHQVAKDCMDGLLNWMPNKDVNILDFPYTQSRASFPGSQINQIASDNPNCIEPRKEFNEIEGPDLYEREDQGGMEYRDEDINSFSNTESFVSIYDMII